MGCCARARARARDIKSWGVTPVSLARESMNAPPGQLAPGLALRCARARPWHFADRGRNYHPESHVREVHHEEKRITKSGKRITRECTRCGKKMLNLKRHIREVHLKELRKKTSGEPVMESSLHNWTKRRISSQCSMEHFLNFVHFHDMFPGKCMFAMRETFLCFAQDIGLS